jgi:hypothetical protein
MAMGVNGWVATPGGRLWFVDGRTGALEQVCGADAFRWIPAFVPEEHGPVPETLSLDGLYRGSGGRAERYSAASRYSSSGGQVQTRCRSP